MRKIAIKHQITSFLVGILYMLITIAVISCSGDADEIQVGRDIEINNDIQYLNSRMTISHEPLEVVSQNNARVSSISLTLVGTLDAPFVEEEQLQATSILAHDENYLVSYNFRGEDYRGGVDYITSALVVQSQILYHDADIHSLTASGDYAYLTGAKEGALPPAYVEKVLIENGQFSLTGNVFQHLGSYAANSAIPHQGSMMVTTGDDENNGGGVYKLDMDLNLIDYMPLHDARWMSGNGNDLFIGQGTPGTVSQLSSNKMEFEASYTFEGANEPESKTTIEVADKMIFIAGGTSGVIVLDANDGHLLTTLTFDDDCITNAISADKGLLFISNGEGGAYVANYDQKDETSVPVVMGKIELGAGVSVNHILYRNDKLWIASGLGGVKVVEVSEL